MAETACCRAKVHWAGGRRRMMGLVVKVSHQLAALLMRSSGPPIRSSSYSAGNSQSQKWERERQLLINTGWTLLSSSLAFLQEPVLGEEIKKERRSWWWWLAEPGELDGSSSRSWEWHKGVAGKGGELQLLARWREKGGGIVQLCSSFQFLASPQFEKGKNQMWICARQTQ